MNHPKFVDQEQEQGPIEDINRAVGSSVIRQSDSFTGQESTQNPIDRIFNEIQQPLRSSHRQRQLSDADQLSATGDGASHPHPRSESEDRPSKRTRYSVMPASSTITLLNQNQNNIDKDKQDEKKIIPSQTTALDLSTLLKNFNDGLQAISSSTENHHSVVSSPYPSGPPWPSISDIDREEIVRLLLQSLKEIGYPAAAMTLEVESGFTLDPSPEISSFRQNVLNGKWIQVDELLQREYSNLHRPSSTNNSSPTSPIHKLASDSDSRITKSLFGVDPHILKLARFLIIQEKYLELLESRQIRKALVVLRNEIAPLVTPPTSHKHHQNGSSSTTTSLLSNGKKSITKTNSNGIFGSSFDKLSSAAIAVASTYSPSGWNGTQSHQPMDQDIEGDDNDHEEEEGEDEDDEDPGVQRLCLLSSLIMCADSHQVRIKAGWSGVANGSRLKVLEELQELIPPTKLIPHQRLAELLEQSKNLQRLQCIYHINNPQISLLLNHKCNRSNFPTQTSHILNKHKDEVWRIEWSHDGLRLASADRAKTCIIWKIKSSTKSTTQHTNGFSHPGVTLSEDSTGLASSRFLNPSSSSSADKKPSAKRPHLDSTSSHEEEFEFEIDLVLDKHPDGIACIAWSPDDSVLLTGSDCTINMWNTKTGDCIATMVKHKYDVGALSWLPDGRHFISGGLDSNILFWDLKGQNTYIWKVGPTRINDLAVSPDGKRLIVIGTATIDTRSSSTSSNGGTEQAQDNLNNGSDDRNLGSHTRSDDHHPPTSATPGGAASGDINNKKGRIHIFDIQEKKQIRMITLSPELSCVSISDDSKFALINQSPNQVLLYSIEEHKLIRRFVGQKQTRFIIRSCFGGDERNFILSGSEDGQIYVWHLETGSLIEVLSGHRKNNTVNAVAWNPVLNPPIFASACDDHTVRIWQAPNPNRTTPITNPIDHTKAEEVSNHNHTHNQQESLRVVDPTPAIVNPTESVASIDDDDVDVDVDDEVDVDEHDRFLGNDEIIY
ncbi:hypothetical protein PSTG_14111 [Puccinia striiformis f. sp. tritici PST-78]|uniref:CTLH domain-containing protein n=1 Tax=Puccinia striiformis f. sp. tritici PST-78 TaxID=1165861 RepID=A0A0L0UZR2_9BASI|nr:hypothetical protein PSTG_14111 [Puccinia striiformis f. sp. tritici PST-78]